MTVGVPSVYGTAWVKWASVETPRTSTASTQLMATRVRRALRPCGSRNAEMPFEIASSPVRDEPPLAKERSTMKREAPYSQPSPGVPSGTTPAACRSARGSSPAIPRTAATRSTSPTAAMKRYAGSANIRPASRMPRRFPYASRTITATETGSWRWSRPVQLSPARWASEIRALVPAETWTATVTM